MAEQTCLQRIVSKIGCRGFIGLQSRTDDLTEKKASLRPRAGDKGESRCGRTEMGRETG
jgi:hypothetical protein